MSTNKRLIDYDKQTRPTREIILRQIKRLLCRRGPLHEHLPALMSSYRDIMATLPKPKRPDPKDDPGDIETFDKAVEMVYGIKLPSDYGFERQRRDPNVPEPYPYPDEKRPPRDALEETLQTIRLMLLARIEAVAKIAECGGR